MEKWKELSVGRKRFWMAVGVIVAIALVGWATGWWSSPEPVVGDGIPASSVHVVPLVGSDCDHTFGWVRDARVMNDYSHDTGRPQPRECSLRRSRMPFVA